MMNSVGCGRKPSQPILMYYQRIFLVGLTVSQTTAVSIIGLWAEILIWEC
jgi:hypothetical protein